MTLAVRAEGVEKRFGPTTALDSLDLELRRGSSIAVLGPNGAGKSTLLRLMAGLARPTGGSLQVAGEPAHSPQARARVGLVGHASFLYPQLTARENLHFAARLQRVPDYVARADRLLADEGLADVADRAAGTFSRGMAQRLAIARGLVHDPEVVLLDEPFTGLDGPAARRLTARLTELRHDGRSLVLVTHDPRRATELADDTVVLSRGRVVYRGCGGASAAPDLERAYFEASETP